MNMRRFTVSDAEPDLGSGKAGGAGPSAGSAGKRPYRKPSLTNLGSVRDLTGNGTGSGGDGSGDPTMAKQSDPRCKENIVRVGEHPAGFGLYLFDYKPAFRDDHGHGRQFGVMADEVARIVPEAVVMRESGYLAVDYARLGITRH
jgi:hypothetical protein